MDAAHQKLKALTAVEVCEICELETDVTEWLDAKPDADTFLQQLTAAGHHLDALKFLCHALEPREAVWLAWDAASRLPASDDPKIVDALAKTHQWLTSLSEKARRAAHAASEASGLESSAGVAALAAFFADGSIGPEELPEPILPDPGTCAKAAVGALMFAAVAVPQEAEERTAASVQRWFELAATEPLWGVPPVSSAGSKRIPEQPNKAEAPAAPPPTDAPAGDATRITPAPQDAPSQPPSTNEDHGYDDSGYNTDMKF